MKLHLNLYAALAAVHIVYALPASQNATMYNKDLQRISKIMGADVDLTPLRQDMTLQQLDIMHTMLSATKGLGNMFGLVAQLANTATPRTPTTRVATEDLGNAKSVAEFAGMVYCKKLSEGPVETQDCGIHCSSSAVQGARVERLIEGNGMRALVGTMGDGTPIVSFRGTNNEVNEAQNKKLSRIPFAFGNQSTDMQIHGGFSESYAGVRDNVIQTLQQMQVVNSAKPLVLTGHSLGASVATIAAVDLNMNMNIRPELIMFASPRTGNQAFADAVPSATQKVMRFTEENDIVPHLVLQSLGYMHVAGENYVTAQQAFSCEGTEDGQCSNSRIPFLTAAEHSKFFGQTFFGVAGCNE